MKIEQGKILDRNPTEGKKKFSMKIINKQFLVLVSGQNMNNIHLCGKLALWHNSTLVSESEGEIQEI